MNNAVMSVKEPLDVIVFLVLDGRVLAVDYAAILKNVPDRDALGLQIIGARIIAPGWTIAMHTMDQPPELVPGVAVVLSFQSGLHAWYGPQDQDPGRSPNDRREPGPVFVPPIVIINGHGGEDVVRKINGCPGLDDTTNRYYMAKAIRKRQRPVK